jgi:hypothetical protein
MRSRGRRQALLALVATAMLVLSLPTSMASATETYTAPSNLRQVGVDEFGAPLLTFERGTESQYGYYDVLYSPKEEQSFGAMGSGRLSDSSTYATVWDWLGYCLEGGAYAVQVRFVSSSGSRSGWSNTISIELPDLF